MIAQFIFLTHFLQFLLKIVICDIYFLLIIQPLCAPKVKTHYKDFAAQPLRLSGSEWVGEKAKRPPHQGQESRIMSGVCRLEFDFLRKGHDL